MDGTKVFMAFYEPMDYFSIDPTKYGFSTLAEFLQDISKDGEIVLENGRVKLAKYVSEKEKNGLGLKMNFPKNIDKDKKEEETLPGLENEISREIEQLNLQVSTI